MKMNKICWLITTRCNQNCKYCHRFLKSEKLSFEENKELLKKLIQYGITHITWSGGKHYSTKK